MQAFSYFLFHSQWLCFDIRICFISWYSYGITSSAVELKICAIIAGMKKYKSIIKKNKKRHDKIMLLAKAYVNTFEVFISKALIDLYISH